MPEFLVEFDRPVWYQPDNPKIARETQALCVNSDTERNASVHALRVTRGPGDIKTVYPIAEAPEHLVIIARTLYTLPMIVDPETGQRSAIGWILQQQAGKGDPAGGQVVPLSEIPRA